MLVATMRILFICTGNIMRSVIAECVLRRRAEELLGCRAVALTSESCGIEAAPGSPPHPETLRSLEKLGIPACDTTSSPVNETRLSASDLVLTMTRWQCYALARISPAHRQKCFSIIEVNGVIESLLEDRGIRLDDKEWWTLARRLEQTNLESALERGAELINLLRRGRRKGRRCLTPAIVSGRGRGTVRAKPRQARRSSDRKPTASWETR
ncbi:MAG: hypothetical protein CVT63_00860 [Candidatus Anoxymicrobium japonicum]|uniref:protein-tyrosine-phosphatase n=1 Tax=Candidatus Anoxymicrobium japonicum TaxID=2013648 RepID=A0A2N3G815_9ACTN|nr:MAG: hypothetical protein CVT63_00860 [Candidatus Anoxymicrobium japonicum]